MRRAIVVALVLAFPVVALTVALVRRHWPATVYDWASWQCPI